MKKAKASKQIKYDSKQIRNGYKVNNNNNNNNNKNYNYSSSMSNSISSGISSGSAMRGKRSKKMKGGVVSDRPAVVPLSKSNGCLLISYTYPPYPLLLLIIYLSYLLLLLYLTVGEIYSLVQQQRGNSSILPFYHLQSHQPYPSTMYCTTDTYITTLSSSLHHHHHHNHHPSIIASSSSYHHHHTIIIIIKIIIIIINSSDACILTYNANIHSPAYTTTNLIINAYIYIYPSIHPSNSGTAPSTYLLTS